MKSIKKNEEKKLGYGWAEKKGKAVQLSVAPKPQTVNASNFALSHTLSLSLPNPLHTDKRLPRQAASIEQNITVHISVDKATQQAL